MEGAAQPAILEPAEGEVGAAVRAVAVDQAVAAFFVAKQHEVFAEQFDGAHRPRISAGRRKRSLSEPLAEQLARDVAAVDHQQPFGEIER